MNKRIFEAQKNIIETNIKDIDRLEKDIESFKNNIAMGKFYMNMQEKILENEDLKQAWKTFIMMIRLTIDSEKGITE